MTGVDGTIGAAGAIDGSKGYESGSGAASLLSLAGANWSPPATGQWVYFGARIRISALPAQAVTVMHFRVGTLQVSALQLLTDGTLRLMRLSSSAGTPTVTLVPGQAYNVELGHRVNVGSADNIAFRVDNTLIGSVDYDATDGQINNPRIGWCSTPGSASTARISVDTVVINDDTGVADNTWPGAPSSGSVQDSPLLDLSCESDLSGSGSSLLSAQPIDLSSITEYTGFGAVLTSVQGLDLQSDASFGGAGIVLLLGASDLVATSDLFGSGVLYVVGSGSLTAFTEHSGFGTTLQGSSALNLEASSALAGYGQSSTVGPPSLDFPLYLVLSSEETTILAVSAPSPAVLEVVEESPTSLSIPEAPLAVLRAP